MPLGAHQPLEEGRGAQQQLPQLVQPLSALQSWGQPQLRGKALLLWLPKPLTSQLQPPLQLLQQPLPQPCRG